MTEIDRFERFQMPPRNEGKAFTNGGPTKGKRQNINKKKWRDFVEKKREIEKKTKSNTALDMGSSPVKERDFEKEIERKRIREENRKELESDHSEINNILANAGENKRESGKKSKGILRGHLQSGV